MRAQTATIRGIPMRWEEQGEGTPVVLLHGIPTSPKLWRHVVPRLAGVRALAWGAEPHSARRASRVTAA